MATYENHSVEVDELVRYCPIESIEVKWANELLEDWVNDCRNFPETLEECLKIENGEEE